MNSVLQKIHDVIDVRAAAGLEIGREHIKEWLLFFTRSGGLALLILTAISAIKQEWLYVTIFACTLYLQIVFRYSFRVATNEEIWPVQEPPKNSKNG